MSEALRYPELSKELKARGFGAMLRIFGPGAIIASVTIGSGGDIQAQNASGNQNFLGQAAELGLDPILYTSSVTALTRGTYATRFPSTMCAG